MGVLRTVILASTALYGLVGQAQHMIDLSKADLSKLWRPDHAAHSLMVDSVVLTFDPVAPIGVVRKGLGNREEKAFLTGPVDEELKGLLDRMHTAGGLGEHIFLKVDLLDIQEARVVNSQMAYCRFAADVLQVTDSGIVRLYTYATNTVEKGGADATDDHVLNIATVVDNCLRRTAFMMRSGLLRPEPFHHLLLGKATPAQPERLHPPPGKTIPKGTYFSFMDFRDGTPDTTVNFALKETNKSTANAREVRPKGENYDLKAWGLSDGERFYVNAGREYVELKFDEPVPYTYWVPYASDTEVANAYFAGGMIGGMITASTRESAPTRLDLDPITGSLQRHYAQEGSPSATAQGARNHFCYSRYSKIDTTVVISMYGGEEARLRKGQYHIVQLAPRATSVPMGISIGTATETVNMDTSKSGDQVYLIKVDGSGRITVDHMREDLGYDVIDKLRPEDEVD